MSTAVAPAAHAQAAGNFLVPNGTFIFEWIVFGLVLLFLWRKVVPMINQRMEERQEAIRRQFEEAEKSRALAEETLREYKKAQQDMRAELAQIREEAAERARRTIEQAEAEARERTEARLARAEQDLAAERQRVFDDLRAEIGRLAVALAGRLVGEELTDEERQQRVVDRFLTDLEESSGTPAERVS